MKICQTLPKHSPNIYPKMARACTKHVPKMAPKRIPKKRKPRMMIPFCFPKLFFKRDVLGSICGAICLPFSTLFSDKKWTQKWTIHHGPLNMAKKGKPTTNYHCWYNFHQKNIFNNCTNNAKHGPKKRTPPKNKCTVCAMFEPISYQTYFKRTKNTLNNT